jgi:hypothetical protein
LQLSDVRAQRSNLARMSSGSRFKALSSVMQRYLVLLRLCPKLVRLSKHEQ